VRWQAIPNTYDPLGNWLACSQNSSWILNHFKPLLCSLF